MPVSGPQDSFQIPKEPRLSSLQYPPMTPIENIVSSILKKPPAIGIESALNELRLEVSVQFVDDVLKLSYGAGMEALRFFRWDGWNFDKKHNPTAWNLLGKDKLFDAMWDCIKVMKNEGIVSMETIFCVFRNYVQAHKVDEVIMTFEVMENYGFHDAKWSS